jgi:serine/threonine protein kinase
VNAATLFSGTIRDAHQILVDIMEALAYMHRQGVLHNDLKCDNVLITGSTDELRAIICDLGFASNGPVKTSGGSPWYVAPEVYTGGSRNKDTDIWAIGVLSLFLAGALACPEMKWPNFNIAAAIAGEPDASAKQQSYLRHIEETRQAKMSDLNNQEEPRKTILGAAILMSHYNPHGRGTLANYIASLRRVKTAYNLQGGVEEVEEHTLDSLSQGSGKTVSTVPNTPIAEQEHAQEENIGIFRDKGQRDISPNPTLPNP